MVTVFKLNKYLNFTERLSELFQELIVIILVKVLGFGEFLASLTRLLLFIKF